MLWFTYLKNERIKQLQVLQFSVQKDTKHQIEAPSSAENQCIDLFGGVVKQRQGEQEKRWKENESSSKKPSCLFWSHIGESLFFKFRHEKILIFLNYLIFCLSARPSLLVLQSAWTVTSYWRVHAYTGGQKHWKKRRKKEQSFQKHIWRFSLIGDLLISPSIWWCSDGLIKIIKIILQFILHRVMAF